jgi:hypothetical protein
MKNVTFKKEHKEFVRSLIDELGVDMTNPRKAREIYMGISLYCRSSMPIPESLKKHLVTRCKNNFEDIEKIALLAIQKFGHQEMRKSCGVIQER